MTRSMTLLILAIGCLTATPGDAPAQSFGRDTERARLDAMGRSLTRDEEGIARTKAWLTEQCENLLQRNNQYQRRRTALYLKIAQWRCPNGYSVKGCRDRPPVCAQTREFAARALTEAEALDRESRAINVERQRLEDLAQSLDRRVIDYTERKERYRGDVLDFGRRYRGYSNDKQLEFDDSSPKSRPR